MAGQNGDLAMCVVLARAIKEYFPGCHYTMTFTRKYREIAPLFLCNPLIDALHFWDATYHDWPSLVDREFVKNYDIVLHPFCNHRELDWFKYRHQCAEVPYMYGLPIPQNLKIDLTPYFEFPKYDDTVTFAVFGGNNSPEKRLSNSVLGEIISYLTGRGFKCLQLGGENEPDCPGLDKTHTSYFDSVKLMLGSRLLIAVDTGLNWVASGYNHPVLGLYSNAYYGDFITNIQPINPNGHYLDAQTIHDIPAEQIIEKLKEIL